MDKNAIIKEANEKLKELLPIIDKLHNLGISKVLEMGNKSSHIVVTYPPVNKLSIHKEEKIFKNISGKNTLYIHIPFCTGICTYCNYSRTAISEEDERIKKYLEYLDKESQLLKSEINVDKIQVESIYIGGGTPTLLSEEDLEKLLKIIKRDYDLINEGEYTVEGSPETITLGKVALAKFYGVNRFSIGIESFNDNVLENIGRRHNAKGAFKAIELIRKAGINEIDFDLIRGLPNYTPEIVASDMEMVEKTNVPSVTSYQHSLKPFSLDTKRLPSENPKEKEQVLMHIIFLLGMKKLGYLQKPIDWFIKTEKNVYHHQILKWKNMANQLVLGRSSYGYVNGIQFSNYKSRKEYEEAIDSGKLPIEKATKLSNEDIIRRRFIFGLKTGIDRKQFKKDYGVDPTEASFKDTLNLFVEAGGIKISNSTIGLTEVGSLFADYIQMAFYSKKYM